MGEQAEEQAGIIHKLSVYSPTLTLQGPLILLKFPVSVAEGRKPVQYWVIHLGCT